MKHIKEMFIHPLLLSAITCASIALTSCGGGTIGTGITSLGGKAYATRDLTFDASLTIIDSRGKPCAGAEVSVQSKSQTFSGKATTAGTVILPLAIRSGEMLTFSVRCATRTYQTKDYLSPAGASTVTRILKLVADGSVEITEP